jgi:hypothetical protein
MAEEQRDRQSIGTSRPLTTQGGFGYTMSYGQQPQGSGWFGPLTPLAPVAPNDVKGRILDFPVGYNIQSRPRAYEPVTFQMLRNFADAYDLLRLVIETRKDQLGRMDWNIAPRDYVPKEQMEGLKAKAIEIEKFFVRPDKENFWDEWLRAMLEDLFVIDAPAIFRRRTYGGDLYALQLIDGGTIKRIIDDHGNTPEDPNPAYQQILHGLPAVNYTTKELLYRPRNKRTHKVYGFSPVEQIVMTMQIALRRQMWQLQSFTEGNVPEALIGTPMTWTPDQIKQFQDWFDSQLEGNTGARRRARFVPGEVAKAYVPTKDGELFGQAEEWLARVVCFCFSISPQPFVKMMNRATAETAQETAVEEGLAPVQSYIKNTWTPSSSRTLVLKTLSSSGRTRTNWTPTSGRRSTTGSGQTAARATTKSASPTATTRWSIPTRTARCTARATARGIISSSLPRSRRRGTRWRSWRSPLPQALRATGRATTRLLRGGRWVR